MYKALIYHRNQEAPINFEENDNLQDIDSGEFCDQHLRVHQNTNHGEII